MKGEIWVSVSKQGRVIHQGGAISMTGIQRQFFQIMKNIPRSTDVLLKCTCTRGLNSAKFRIVASAALIQGASYNLICLMIIICLNSRFKFRQRLIFTGVKVHSWIYQWSKQSKPHKTRFMHLPANNIDSAIGHSGEVRGHPREHPEAKPRSPHWDQGGIKAKMMGRKEEEWSCAAGPKDLWKTPDKGTGKLGRLGQVLWDRHKPSEGEAFSVLT